MLYHLSEEHEMLRQFVQNSLSRSLLPTLQKSTIKEFLRSSSMMLSLRRVSRLLESQSSMVATVRMRLRPQ